MKRFLVHSCAFAFFTLLLGFGYELLLLTRSNEYSYKRKYVEQNGDKIKVLILGHSHANQGIDPDVMGDSVFNMSINGREHYYDAIIAERYVPTLNELGCVIMPLGYNLQYSSYKYPCTTREGEEIGIYNRTYKCMYYKYMDICPQGGIPYQYWSEMINSKLAYGNRLWTKDFEKLNGCTPSGFHKANVSSKQDNWKMGRLPLIVDYDSHNALLALEEGLNDFKRIAKVCHDNNVRLVVVTTPCYSTFRKRVTERGIREMYDCVDTMRTVCPSLEYYNYINDERFGDDDMFFDSSHLTEVGARKFSEVLRNEVFSALSKQEYTP